MTHQISTNSGTASGPKITILMVLCGVVGFAGSGAISAAPAANVGPEFSIKYSPESLNTDSGVRALYSRLVRAAEDVCPVPTGTRVISSAIRECRTNAVAQVVNQINNPRLAALLAGNSKSG